MERFRHFRFFVRTLAPVHIGGAGSLSPTEFVYFNGRVYVVSEDRLGQALEKKALLENFADRVAQGGLNKETRVSLEGYLKGRNLLNESFAKGVALYSTRSDSAPYPELRPFVRDGFLRPFIPGSAVKGALRVAILYTLLNRLDPEKRRNVLDDFVGSRLKDFEEEWKDESKQIKERTKDLDDEARNRVFGRAKRKLQNSFKGRFSVSWEQNFFEEFTLSLPFEKIDAHTDVFRVLRISDSTPFDKDRLKVKEIKVYSMGQGEKKFSIFAECLPLGNSFEIKVTLDTELLRDFAKKNTLIPRLDLPFSMLTDLLENPLHAMTEMTHDVLAYERKVWGKNPGGMLDSFSFEEEPNFRLGWGGGLLSTTVTRFFSEGLRQNLRDTLFVPRSGSPAPKSRRRTTGGLTLGWLVVRCSSALSSE